MQCILDCRRLLTLVNVIRSSINILVGAGCAFYWIRVGYRQLGILFGFSSNRQLAVGYFIWISGKLSGFQATGNWESYPDFNAISSRPFSLDFVQSAVKELYPKMYQKRITKRVSKNRGFPLKAILRLQNPSKARSQTPLKIEYKSPLILESLKLKNKQALQTFPHFFKF